MEHDLNSLGKWKTLYATNPENKKENKKIIYELIRLEKLKEFIEY